MKIIRHFFKITKHRFLVRKYCFKCGLIWQGLVHDLSKYSPTEFFKGAKYYAGIYSPHHNERKEKGYSLAWMHHKGRNKHHGEYWLDYNMVEKKYTPVQMPKKFIVENVCDRIAASKIYWKKNFTSSTPLDYFLGEKNTIIMHEETKKTIEYLLTMYKDEGPKKTFKFIRKVFLKNKKK